MTELYRNGQTNAPPEKQPTPLRRHFPLYPEMLFDRGDALKRVIDFLSVSGDVGHARSELIELAPNICKFRADFPEILSRLVPKFIKLLPKRFQLPIRRRKLILRRHLRSYLGDIILGRHVFDDVREHFSDFFERRFFCPHT